MLPAAALPVCIDPPPALSPHHINRLAEAEEDLDEDEVLLARMDAGLFTLQQVGAWQQNPASAYCQPRIRCRASNKLTGGLWCALAPAPRLIHSAHPPTRPLATPLPGSALLLWAHCGWWATSLVAMPKH